MHPFIAHELIKIHEAELRAEADQHRLAAGFRTQRQPPRLPALGSGRRTAHRRAQTGAC